MATTIAAYTRFPHTERITLGSTPAATEVILPDVAYPVVVSIKPITNAARLAGANAGVADAGSLTANYNTLTADRWTESTIPGRVEGGGQPKLYIASGTSSTVVEINIVAAPVRT